MTVLVTGSCGFIGFHLCKRLLEQGESVVGVDNLNSYYEPKLKKDRLSILQQMAVDSQGSFANFCADITDSVFIDQLFDDVKPKSVVNLAAQAGVRYSIENPNAYIQSNVVGFLNIIESSYRHGVSHLLYASSSSVYGGNTNMPFSESQGVDHPVSLYAATKRTNELMAHAYSHLHGLPVTGLRFFTVYGPWGRPDMALYLFTKSILAGEPIKLFNNGVMKRDFTYVDDIVESIYRLLQTPAQPDSAFDTSNPNVSTSWAPYRIFNIGNSSPSSLIDYVSALEQALGRTAIKQYLPMQPGDVPATEANTTSLQEWIGYKPKTTVSSGVKQFVEWYLKYYKISI